MVEPVVAQYILLSAIAAAMAVMFGASYAMFFAWSKIKKNPRYMLGAYASYAVFAIFTAILTYTLHLTGFWYLIVATMLIGYWLAPYGIWYLCVRTHDHKKVSD